MPQTPYTLTKLVNHCKSLRSICVEGEGSEEQLVAKHEPNPETEFDAGASRIEYERRLYRLIWDLAHYNGLEELELSTLYDGNIMPGLLKRISALERPFKDLRKLSLGVRLEGKTVSRLVPKLNADSLTALDVVITHESFRYNSLQRIGSLRNLQNLSIVCVDNIFGRNNDILPLTNLKRLRSLKLNVFKFRSCPTRYLSL